MNGCYCFVDFYKSHLDVASNLISDCRCERVSELRFFKVKHGDAQGPDPLSERVGFHAGGADPHKTEGRQRGGDVHHHLAQHHPVQLEMLKRWHRPSDRAERLPPDL